MDYVKYIRERVGHDAINLTGANVLIINSENKVLLQKRGNYPYVWGLIGGVTELGEALEETALREAREETGLEVEELCLLGVTSGKDCYMHLPNEDKVYFISIGYYTKKFSGELKADQQETLDLRFFAYDELPVEIPKTYRKFIDLYYNNKQPLY